MFYREIARTLGLYLWGLTIPLSIPFFIAVFCEYIVGSEVYPQPDASIPFLITIALALGLGWVFKWIGRKGSGLLFRREALLLVLVVYLLTPAFGALPFLLSGTLENPIDAYFESVSGLTTTGATVMQAKKYDPKTNQNLPITATLETGGKTTYTYYGTITPVVDSKTGQVLLTGLDAVSPALLFWRSLMQWLGGGGIIVLFVAILPALGVGGKVLYQTEVTGPSKESMAPRIKETASQLWKIYLGLTLLEVILLFFTNDNLSLFDAFTVSFSTLSTGGFTPKNQSIASFDSPWTDGVVMVFMILGSISFSLYFFCMRGKFSRLADPELKIFLLIILLSCAFATWQLHGKPLTSLQGARGDTLTWLEAFRYGSFQVISAQTSTGFVTANYDVWPFSIQTLMLILMFVGGMAGSTAGGLKVIRQQMFFKTMLGKIETIFRPDTVRMQRIGSAVISENLAMTVLCYFMIAASLTIIGTFFLVFDGVDPETSLTTIACMMNNVGIAFRMGGPSQSFAFLSDFGKLLSSLWMIAGRLEFFALLIAFVPAFWRTD